MNKTLTYSWKVGESELSLSLSEGEVSVSFYGLKDRFSIHGKDRATEFFSACKEAGKMMEDNPDAQA